MESSQIGLYEISVCAFVFRQKAWFTTLDVTRKMNVHQRTARWHLARLTGLGILERRRVFGGCRYRVRDEGEMDERAIAYLRRLTKIKETFERKPGRIRTTLASFAAMLAV